MVYKFIDVNEANLKSYASIQTIVDGFNLDTDLIGYRTLNVSGRSVFGRDVETLKYSSRKSAGRKSIRNSNVFNNTNKFLSSRNQDLVITVDFMLEAENNEQFRERLSYLSSFLHQGELKWSFTDDFLYYYQGVMTEMGDFKEDKNCVVSNFKILCVDCFKISYATKEIEGSGQTIKLPDAKNNISYQLIDMYLQLEEAANSFYFEEKTENAKTILNYDFKAKDKLIFKVEENVLYLNGLNIMTAVDLSSNLEGFGLYPNGEIYLSKPCSYKFKYKLRSY